MGHVHRCQSARNNERNGEDNMVSALPHRFGLYVAPKLRQAREMGYRDVDLRRIGALGQFAVGWCSVPDKIGNRQILLRSLMITM